MRCNLISDLWIHIEGNEDFKVDHCPKETSDIFEEIDMPIDMKRMFQWRWPQVDVRLSYYEVDCAKNIPESEDFSRLIKQNMVRIGSGPNGDLLVVRWLDNEAVEVGVIDHANFWPNEDQNPESWYVKMTDTFEEFLYKIAHNQFLPSDYHVAIELASFKSETGQS